jgi:putative two-component system response regulator
MAQTVMIVDDSRPLHALVKVHLGEEDFVYHSAYNGSSALNLVTSVKPDLILLDVDMPDMNGFDVCRFLKVDPITAQIPIIFLTASTSADEKACGLSLQANDYVTKPFDPEGLLARVRAALRTKRLLDLLPPSNIATAGVTLRGPCDVRPSLSKTPDATVQN